MIWVTTIMTSTSFSYNISFICIIILQGRKNPILVFLTLLTFTNLKGPKFYLGWPEGQGMVGHVVNTIWLLVAPLSSIFVSIPSSWPKTIYKNCLDHNLRARRTTKQKHWKEGCSIEAWSLFEYIMFIREYTSEPMNPSPFSIIRNNFYFFYTHLFIFILIRNLVLDNKMTKLGHGAPLLCFVGCYKRKKKYSSYWSFPHSSM
jgi:hypothetical protein